MSAEVLKKYDDLLKSIRSNLNLSKYSYTVMDLDTFRLKGLNDIQRIYWEEILQRAHLATVGSLYRNHKILRAVINGIEDENMLQFASILRSLIESCGDTFLSLQSVSLTLAENYSLIKNNLLGDGVQVMINKKLEEILIHFAYGRKVKRNQDTQTAYPKYHNTKPSLEYLRQLDNGVVKGDIYKLWAYLSEFDHPAAQSVLYILQQEDKTDYSNFYYHEEADFEHIQFILKEYQQEITDTLMYGFNSSIITLKTLNFFDLDKVKTYAVENINCDSIKHWRDIESKVTSANNL